KRHPFSPAWWRDYAISRRIPSLAPAPHPRPRRCAYPRARALLVRLLSGLDEVRDDLLFLLELGAIGASLGAAAKGADAHAIPGPAVRDLGPLDVGAMPSLPQRLREGLRLGLAPEGARLELVAARLPLFRDALALLQGRRRR